MQHHQLTFSLFTSTPDPFSAFDGLSSAADAPLPALTNVDGGGAASDAASPGSNGISMSTGNTSDDLGMGAAMGSGTQGARKPIASILSIS